MQRVAERRSAVRVADDRLAQVEPRLAQPPRRPLGAVERRRPAAGEVDGLALGAGRQRRDQEREGGGALAGVAAQGTDQLRVLGGAGGDDEGLAALRAVVVLHLSASFGAVSERPFAGAPLHPAAHC